MAEKAGKRRRGDDREEQGECSATLKRSRQDDEWSGGPSVRASKWFFTTTSKENYWERMGNRILFIGPAEPGSDGLRGPAHGGLVHIGDGASNEAETIQQQGCIRKGLAHRMLTSAGIATTYLQPAKGNKEQMVRYIYKTVLSQDQPIRLSTGIPDIVKTWMGMERGVKSAAKGITEREAIQEIYEKYGTKTSRGTLMRELTKKFGLGYAETKIKRAHQLWPKNTRPKVRKLLKVLSSKKAKKMSGKQALTTLKKILMNVKKVTWKGKKISGKELQIMLQYAAWESRGEEAIEDSPHFLFEGTAGSGKTMLARLLFPDDISASIPNDSKGVGALEMGVDQNVLKVDDASEAFWANSELLSSIYTMYKNSWEAKTHGSKQKNAGTMAVITSNNIANLDRIGEACDYEGAERRFCVAEFHGTLVMDQQFKIDNSTSQELLEEWLQEEIVMEIVKMQGWQ